MEPARPSGFPRKEWKTLSAKKKAALVHPPKMAKAVKSANSKKWYVSADTSFGQFAAGSGNARPRSRKTDSSETAVSSYVNGPSAIQLNAGPQGRGQPITQRELVALVGGSSAFASTSWQLQPGLSSVFVWLSSLAKLYQKYSIRHVRLIYKPSVSSFDPLGSRGKCAISFDTDALGSPISTFIQAEGMTPNVRFMPYQDCELDITPSVRGTRFVRTGPVPSGADAKTYDAGTIYFSTDGFSGSGVIGELHCEYTIDLVNPILPNSIPASINLTRTTLTATQIMANSTVTLVPVWTVIYNALGFDLTGGNITGVSGNFLVTVNTIYVPSSAGLGTTESRTLLNGAIDLNRACTQGTSTTTLTSVTAAYAFVISLRETDIMAQSSYCVFGPVTVQQQTELSIVAI
jgi:hypothetical protein